MILLSAEKGLKAEEIAEIVRESAVTAISWLKRFKPWGHYLQASYRKIVATTGSLIEKLLPKSIHAVTARGLELKVAIFVLACGINYFFR